MHIAQVVSTALLGASAVAAQGLNFTVIFQKIPSLAHATPIPVKPFYRRVEALKIINSLSSSHAVALAQATHKPTTKKASKPATSPAKVKATSTSKVSAKPKASSTGKPKALRFKRAPAPASASVPVVAAAACAPLTVAYGYTPPNNTALGFAIDTTLVSTSTSGLAPAGYTRAFAGQLGSIFNDTQYITYYDMPSFNTSACAAKCDSTVGCSSFNLYYERLPSLQTGPTCPDPAAVVGIKCALWKNQPTLASAVNKGEYLNNFIVLITGSNVYYKNTPPATISGYLGPTALAAAVDIYSAIVTPYLIGTNFFQGSYNPALCTSWCAALGTSATKPCNYIDAAIISVRGGSPLGTYCMAFTSSVVAQYAYVYNATVNSVTYDVTNSYAYNVAGT